MINGLWSSYASCWFGIDLTPLPEVDLSTNEVEFLSKNLQTIEARPLWYLSYVRALAILNALSLKTSFEAVLFGKSLKSSYTISCWKHALPN